MSSQDWSQLVALRARRQDAAERALAEQRAREVLRRSQLEATLLEQSAWNRRRADRMAQFQSLVTHSPGSLRDHALDVAMLGRRAGECDVRVAAARAAWDVEQQALASELCRLRQAMQRLDGARQMLRVQARSDCTRAEQRGDEDTTDHAAQHWHAQRLTSACKAPRC